MPDRLGFADHLLPVHFFAQGPVLADKGDLVLGVLDGDEYPVEVEWLLDEIECAFLDAVYSRVDVTVAGYHDHSGIYTLSHYAVKNLHAIHAGHLDIAEDDVIMIFTCHAKTCRAVFGSLYFVSFVRKNLFESITDGSLVVNYQNFHKVEFQCNFTKFVPVMKVPDIIIAIDGYSSTGKSSFAKLIAAELDFMYLDSGALYRGVTLFAQRNGLISADNVVSPLLETALRDPYIKLEFTGDRIRTMEVSSQVSPIAAVPYVRTFVDNKLREFGSRGRVVMDGRDIGTTVFPNAQLKLFMTASVEVRARRRYDELLSKGENPDMEQVRKNLVERDYIDSHRETSPLTQAPDAFVLDNSTMSLQEELIWVKGLIQGKFGILE